MESKWGAPFCVCSLDALVLSGASVIGPCQVSVLTLLKSRFIFSLSKCGGCCRCCWWLRWSTSDYRTAQTQLGPCLRSVIRARERPLVSTLKLVFSSIWSSFLRHSFIPNSCLAFAASRRFPNLKSSHIRRCFHQRIVLCLGG